MKKYLMMAAVAITTGLGGNALAMPTFTVAGAGSMQSGFTNQSQVNGGAGHYWSGNSSDGTNKTVGNYLTKSGGFSTTGLNPPISYTNLRSYGGGSVAGGITAANHTYGVSGSGTGNFKVLIEVAGLAAENELWYRQPVTGAPGTSILKRIFAGSAGAGGSSTVTIDGEFSLYLIRTTNSSDQAFLNSKAVSGMTVSELTGLSNTTWAGSNDGSKNSASDQHFASFQDASDLRHMYVGVEDIIPLSGSDKDYNDLIIRMSTLEEVPAPPALVLAALGIPALGLVRRFTRKTPADAVVA
jgi:hypothetical protein